MSEKEILAKMKLAKDLMEKEAFMDAKDAYLDAAEMALKLSKTGDTKKYRKVASRMVEFAKEAQERHKFHKLEDEVNDFPPVSDPDEDFPVPGVMRSKPEVSEHQSKSEDKSKPPKKDGIFANQVPPEIEQYKIGKRKDISIVMGFNDKADQLWRPGDLMNGIMMITGGSGSGKTEWLRSAIIELVADGYPTVVFDLHGDIDTDIPSFSIDYQGKYGINPLELLSTNPSDGGPLPNINRILKLFDDAVSDGFSPTQTAFLRSMLSIAYETAGIKQEDPKTWTRPAPTFEYLRDILIKPDEVLKPVDHLRVVQDILGTNASTIAAVKNRLLPILEHPAFRAEFVVPIESMLEKPVRIILKSLQTVDMQFIVADTVLRHLFTKLQSIGHVTSKEDQDKFRLFVIIDEVKILSGNRGDTSDNFHILNRLATEARKYGMGMLLASQVIRHFGRDIRSNAASKLILRPMDVDEAKANAKEMEIDYQQLMDINLPGAGFYRSTGIDDAIQLRLYPAKDRPIKSFADN